MISTTRQPIVFAGTSTPVKISLPAAFAAAQLGKTVA